AALERLGQNDVGGLVKSRAYPCITDFRDAAIDVGLARLVFGWRQAEIGSDLLRGFPANTSNACLLDEGTQQCAPVSPAPICLIDPHLSQFRNAGPRVTSRDTDHLS